MRPLNYIYTYGFNPEEGELALMEMRAFFGQDAPEKILKSPTSIDPSRSVFIREKLHVLFEGDHPDEVIEAASRFGSEEESYKVIFMKQNDLSGQEHVGNAERLQLARTIGNEMPGKLDLKTPDQIYAIMPFEGKWHFGLYEKSQPVWMKHVDKPQGYSTALSARTARTIVNLMNPHDEALQMIDPCCGIGTVLVEAASMGMLIRGRDKNPLACVGARENLEHYDYPVEIDVEKAVIQELEGSYDCAVLDLPYNLYTHSSYDQQQMLIQHAARLAKRVVIVTIESMDEAIQAAGLRILDRATTTKQRFTREVLLCEKPDSLS